MALTYGDWLKEARRARGLTQKRVSEVAGMGVSHVSRIENGGIDLPTKATRDRIHEALGTSDDDLVSAGILKKYTQTDGTVVYVEPSQSASNKGWSFGETIRQWRQVETVEDAARITGLDPEYLARLEAGLEPIPGFRIREQMISAYDSLDDEFRSTGFIQDTIPDRELSLIRIHPDVADRYSQITEERLDNDHILIHHERAVGLLGDAPALPSEVSDVLRQLDWSNPTVVTRALVMLQTIQDTQRPGATRLHDPNETERRVDANEESKG